MARNRRSPAAHLLHEGARLVDGDRQAAHGDKHVFHDKAAKLWSAYLGVEIRADQVAVMMALFKIARAAMPGLHPDNFVDGAAYIAIAGEIAAARAKSS